MCHWPQQFRGWAIVSNHCAAWQHGLYFLGKAMLEMGNRSDRKQAPSYQAAQKLITAPTYWLLTYWLLFVFCNGQQSMLQLANELI